MLLVEKETEKFFNHTGECSEKMGRKSGRHAAIRYIPLSTIDQPTRDTEAPISMLMWWIF